MMISLRTTSALCAFLIFGCSSPTKPTATAAQVEVPVVRVAKATTVAVLHERGPLMMHPVVKVATLSDITLSDSHLELRVGHYPRGGIGGDYWFVPMVAGQPDLQQQTKLITITAIDGGVLQLYGRRPNLQLHVVSGFREPPIDNYLSLASRGAKKAPFSPVRGGSVGKAIFAWSNNRYLEWRSDSMLGIGPAIPQFRVVGAKDHAPPTVPPSLSDRLFKEGFSVKSVWATTSGMVIVVALAADSFKLTTLIWQDDLARPELLEHPDKFFESLTSVKIIGATSREDAYILLNEDFMRMGTTGWERAGGMGDATPPNMWFGVPLVIEMKSGWFARLAQHAPWRRVEVPDPDAHYFFEVDPQGVIWTRGGDVLFASRPPKTPYHEISVQDLLAARTAAGLELPSNVGDALKR